MSFGPKACFSKKFPLTGFAWIPTAAMDLVASHT
jgi:hypothetical protein